jgi:thioredoxin-related protein
MKKFSAILLGLGMIWLASASVLAGDLPVAQDLQADAKDAGRRHVPLILFYSARSCHYCEEVSSLYLQPILASRDYTGKIILREVQLEGGLMLLDFDGKRVSHADFARRRGISLTPQIRFLDGAGREVSPGIVGYTTPELFGGYLEDAISDAMTKMRTAAP